MDELFFLASKIFWTILSPTSLLLWLILLIVVFLWLSYWRLARLFTTLLAVFAISLVAYPLSDALMYPLETAFPQPDELPENIDGIIVLGGAELLLQSTAWQQPQVGDAADRILAAAKLSRHYPEAPVIFSGGSNLVQRQNLDSTGHVIRQVFAQAGVVGNRLIIEIHARNTAENFALLKTLLPKVDGDYILITSAFHMPRSVGVANMHRVQVIPYPVDYRSHPPSQRYWDFDAFGHLTVMETAWHEWLGLVAYFLTGKTNTLLPTAVIKREEDPILASAMR